MSLLGYRPKAPVNPKDFADLKIRQEWIKTKNITVFSFWRPDKPYQIVDVFIKEPIPFEKMWGKREKIKLQNLTVPVISIKDLKKLKKTANRAQDISDLKALDELNKELHHEQKTHKRG